MILITGTSGFIGSNLLKEVIKAYGKMQVIALTSKPEIGCNYLFHQYYQFSENYFIDNGYENVDTIIHAGAFTPKISSEADNVDKSTSNITNTYNLISSSFPNLKRFIYLSTIDVYGKDDIITEHSLVSPVSLYGESKLYCEKMIKSWAKSKNISCIILRVGHVYGPGEEAYKKLIPITMRQIIDDNPVKLYGKGEDFRSFIFISDVVTAILNSIKLESNFEVINIVGDQSIRVKDLIFKIITMSRKNVQIEHVSIDIPSRDMIFNNSKLKELLHTPIVSLDTGLSLEWDYFNKQ